jgi:hypothetical protein
VALRNVTSFLYWQPKVNQPGGRNDRRPVSAKVLAHPAHLARVAPQSNMKNSQLTSILMGLTAFSAAASIILCGLMITSSREIMVLRMQVNEVNNRRIAATQLINELAEYSKRNPAIEPILQSLAPKAPAPAKPAAK